MGGMSERCLAWPIGLSLMRALVLTLPISLETAAVDAAEDIANAVKAASGTGTIDLRPTFESFGLVPRQQGARPTCSVFTMASAIEFAVAKRQGHTPRLSVE